MLSAVPYVLLFVLLWGKVSIAVIEPHTTRTLSLPHVEENDFYKTKDRKNFFAWTSMKNRWWWAQMMTGCGVKWAMRFYRYF